ncbi:MAG: DegT/DnrJ/EryC1/StrS family aminotransferase [Candidatus Improbicoccus pseudotrichonymphae]|uniref:DegT/DnrJ/EryC1/StrS family aminotransferase n=1 Tax=Candidatus Improbicoccus pseudotrichonymphae TaxID=3033792 RepID=A0AA48I3J6_9FIRM|nr:MAG: DegT/DnrJ/EryC1/StrS family aminotransferase [Candidatus Improbicoccus pseudotrichonymphae]
MKKIEFSPPDITEKEISHVIDTLKSGWITTGNKVREFEQNISYICQTKKTKCMNSATSCLEMVLRILDIQEGDEVITTPYTYAATCNVIYHVGAKPVLVDIDENTLQMNYEKVFEAINKNTKVIIPVDLGGILCDYDKIFEILETKKGDFKPKNFLQEKIGRIVILADSSHSFGAYKQEKISGMLADFTVFSFHAVKNLTCAEGGAVTWNLNKNISDDEIYQKLSLFSLHGQSVDAYSKAKLKKWEYDILVPGFKCNMTDIHASIGLAQLERIEEIYKMRKKIVKIYNEVLCDQNLKIFQEDEKIDSSSCHLYIVNLVDKDENYRNKIMSSMSEKNIDTNIHYKPLPMFTVYKNKGFNIKNFPNAYKVYKNEITLPVHNLMNEEDAFYVADNLKKILNEKYC